MLATSRICATAIAAAWAVVAAPALARRVPSPAAPPVTPAAPATPRTTVPLKVVTPRVAIVDAGNSPASARLATQLSSAVAREVALEAVDDPALAAALIGPLPDESGGAPAAAARALAAAQEHLGRFEPEAAITQAQVGIAQLLAVAPDPAVTVLLGELTFTEGLAQLAARAPAAAAAPLALAHALTPGRTLDPAQYVPEVIEAFEAARQPSGAPGSITIEGAGNVWLDGAIVGRAPLTVPAAAGSHLAIVLGPDRLPRGARIEVSAGIARVVAIADAPASPEVLAQRARRDLRAAPDPTARAAALERIAALADASHVLAVSGDAAALSLLRLRRGQPLPEPESVGKRTPGQLIAPLVPARRDDRPPVRPPPPPLPWWQRRWVQGSAIGVVLVGVATTALLMSGDAGNRGVDPQQGFE